MRRAFPRSRPRHERGYILVALLLLVGAMASIAITYSRHAVIHAHSSSVNSSFVEAHEIAASQLEFVMQSDRAGIPVNADKILGAVKSETTRHDTSLSVAALGNDSVRLGLQALAPDGMGVTRLIEVERMPAPTNLDCNTLPRLEESARLSLTAGKPVPTFTYSTSTTVSNTVLEGLVVIETGVQLTLDNVIVRGMVISGHSLTAALFPVFDPNTAPELVVGGNVRILASDIAPGLAVLMPDGVITTSDSDARLQIVGDVAVHDLTLGCPGTVRGRVASVGDPLLHIDVAHIGAGRAPISWSSALTAQGAFETVSMAFVPRPLVIGDLSTLTDYAFPTVGKPHGKK